MGTITEIYDYLRLLFARAGRPHCPICGEPISRQSPQQIVDRLMALPEGTRFQVLAPVIRGRKGEYQELFGELITQGFTRVRVDGEVHPLATPPTLDKQKKHNIDVVIDRLAVKASIKRRLTDSIETALQLASGVVSIDFVDLPESDPGRERRYSEKLACPNAHDISIEELEPRQFSFNAPWGACPECSGSGTKREVDPEQVVPDRTKSLAETPSPRGRRSTSWLLSAALRRVGRVGGLLVRTPWRDLPERVRGIIRTASRHDPGDDETRHGRTQSFNAKFEGPCPMFGVASPRRRPTTRASGLRATCARCPAMLARGRG